MQNPIQNLDKALLFPRNEVFCLKNWKPWRAPTTLDFNSFCWNFSHTTYQFLQKGVRDVFMCFTTWVTWQNKKIPGF